MTDDLAPDQDKSANDAQTHSFQAEVAKLLHLMVHSVYSEKQVFLRELISNASDACDKLRYQTVLNPELVTGEAKFRIQIAVDAERGLLFVEDNGVGMSQDEMIQNLGTIARSGTSEFVASLSQEDAGQSQLIGQFGVGFYSAFMVADKVSVVSRRADQDEVWTWSSDGMGTYVIEPGAGERSLLDGRGTSICLHLKQEEKQFLDPAVLQQIIKEYSDHISFPIYLRAIGDDAAEPEQVNSSGALWVRPKSEITEEQYKEFYHHVGQMFDDPLLTIHYRAEGRHEYSVLLFLPSQRPMDLFDPKRATRLKLYVKRVFITDDAEMLPGYLRFVRGIIDSEDMPLNLSREMLQHNPIVANIRTAITKRILSELEKVKGKDFDKFQSFWETFGSVLKEGLYEDFERRDQVLDLSLFKSSVGDGWRSLKDYVAEMKDNQTAIYYLRGDDGDAVRRNPQLEGYRARGIEVLLLSDPIDGFWTTSVEGYEGKPFKSIAHGEAELDQFEPLEKDETESEAQADDSSIGTLIAAFKQALEGKISDVRRSNRLTESPVCLVADGAAMDPYMERILAQQGGQAQGEAFDPLKTRILEINPKHELIKGLAQQVGTSGMSDDIENAAYILLEQARLLEGEPVIDAALFSKRLVDFMSKTV